MQVNWFNQIQRIRASREFLGENIRADNYYYYYFPKG